METDVESEVTAFEAEIAAIRSRATRCVEQLRAMSDEGVQYLLAERMRGLGSVIVPDLYALILDDPGSSRAQRYLAAWVAVRVGDRGTAVDHLCREVTSGSPYALPAAHVLARFHLTQGVEAVIEASRSVDAGDTGDTGDTGSMIGWATALRDLGGRLPPEVRRAIATETAPWAAATLLADFPEEPEIAPPGQ